MESLIYQELMQAVEQALYTFYIDTIMIFDDVHIYLAKICAIS